MLALKRAGWFCQTCYWRNCWSYYPRLSWWCISPVNRLLFLKQTNYHKAKILSWQPWLNEHQTSTTCNIRITSTPSIFDYDLCHATCTIRPCVCNVHFALWVKWFPRGAVYPITCNILPQKEHFLVRRKVNLTLWRGKCVFVHISCFHWLIFLCNLKRYKLPSRGH